MRQEEEEEDGELKNRRQGSPAGQQLKSAAPLRGRCNEPPVGRPAGHTEYLNDTHHQLFGENTPSYQTTMQPGLIEIQL